MRHFRFLSNCDRDRLFAHQPREFSRRAPKDTLAVALGATLYMPATRPQLGRDLLRQGAAGVVSSVVCLEDAVADDDLAGAEANLIAQLRRLPVDAGLPPDELPLVFVRVRTPEQIHLVVEKLGDYVGVLSGFVLPKFTEESGGAFLEAVTEAREKSGIPLMVMPVVESPEAVYAETRRDTLLAVRQLLAKHAEMVLAVRIGATDLSAVYGLRRDRDLTIYDVRLVAEVISDVVNILGRLGGDGHVVTGPVWEHFPIHDRLFKPQLRESPFDQQDARSLRRELITSSMDGLIREVVLDKANGLIGKTVIHPSHVAAVHALSVVSHEEHSDACDILRHGKVGGGVSASSYRNKMNEVGPHWTWAERTIRRAAVFGVAARDVSVVDLLSAGVVQS